MLIYSSTKDGFVEDVKQNRIDGLLLDGFKQKLHRGVGESEVRSWRNSLQYMRNVLDDRGIPSDAGVALEFKIPQTSRRIDFILSGAGADDRETMIIVELKQWESAEPTFKDAIVKTYLGKGLREEPHPSYQAWSYAAMLQDFNKTVQDDAVHLRPCAYLHNCTKPAGLKDAHYQAHLEKAPLFLKDDFAKLQRFIRQYIRHGDKKDLLYRVDNGKISPSRSLAEHLASLMQGNQAFLMIDDQKLVYESALQAADEAASGGKRVLLVEGGPGTGKSVVAVNLLVELTKRDKLVQYVSKNAAPRAVYASKLAGTLTRTRIDNLFKSSGSYIEAEPDQFDALLVDEAHRLNEKSGLYGVDGENQIKELISAAKLTVFFLDEHQRVTLKDIGEAASIERWAAELGASVERYELPSQFRCNGQDGFLAWVDEALYQTETGNPTLEGVDFDVRVLDSPVELRELIEERNIERNSARMVAGYCWDWLSKADPAAWDIVFPGHGFKAKWNLKEDGSLWILKESSVREIGCIHTAQGLELDYIGVIIGPDLLVRNGKVQIRPDAHPSRDQAIKGYKKLMREQGDAGLAAVDALIRNTYRTLLSRGMKGCYIWCVDPETNAYFRARMGRVPSSEGVGAAIPFKVLAQEDSRPYENCVPIFDLKVAAGGFSGFQQVDDFQWVALPDVFRPKPGYFICRVVGESMNRVIPNGSWCLFKPTPAGSRAGKVLLVQHKDIQDDSNGGQYTVKAYESVKEPEGDRWRHAKILLKPRSKETGFKTIELTGEACRELRVIGEFVAVVG